MKKYKPVSERSPEQVSKYNAATRLRRMRKRILSGKIPIPKKPTPGADKLLVEHNLLDRVLLPREGMESILKETRRRNNESKRKLYHNVRFK